MLNPLMQKTDEGSFDPGVKSMNEVQIAIKKGVVFSTTYRCGNRGASSPPFTKKYQTNVNADGEIDITHA